MSDVPPDLFSEDGQKWGHPMYRWPVHRRDGFAWWTRRIGRTLDQFDRVRLDHFIAMVRCWQIPADAPTAKAGRWGRGPAGGLVDALMEAFGVRAIIVEDLGDVTPAVEQLRDRYGLSGMRVLQFAFDVEDSVHLPRNTPRNCVYYTGTHDNDTVVGWSRDLRRRARRGETHASASLKRVRGLVQLSWRHIHWKMIEAAMSSRAHTVIVPMQDLLGRDTDARMNTPGTSHGNWSWRMSHRALSRRVSERLAELTQRHKRAKK